MAVMTGEQLAQKCLDIVYNYKTVYASGTFGQKALPSTIDSNAKRLPGWYTKQRIDMLKALPDDTRMFDCCGLIKGIVWGFPDVVYTSNGVPDVNDQGLWDMATDKQQSFSNIQVGELLWMKGHVGVYIGNGKGVECTVSWANKVQITAVANMGAISGLHSRTWQGHGKLPFIEYSGGGSTYNPGHPTLRRGDKGPVVKELQQLLVDKGYNPNGVDGVFGPGCEKAVTQFQADKKLVIDGIVGPKTWECLLEKPVDDKGIPKQVLKKGDNGELVKELQELLVMNGYNPYGDFGTECEKAVKKFQEKNNLVVDGCVGPKTWEALIK